VGNAQIDPSNITDVWRTVMNMESLSELLELIHRTPLEPELWARVMRSMSEAVASCDSARTQQDRLLHLLTRHITTAVRCSLAMRDAESEALTKADALEALATGVLLMDDRGKIVWMNRAAREIIALNDGLAQEGGDLVAATSRETAHLRSIMRRSLPGTGGGLGGQVALSRPSGLPPLLALAGPVSKVRHATVRASRMLVVTDPNRTREALSESLRALWKLSSAEAAIACALADGRTLAQICTDRGVGLQTVRSQLKQIFVKTETHSQPELVRLLMQIPAVNPL
jgi:DNA-binding CsgD family transcriptional regulator